MNPSNEDKTFSKRIFEIFVSVAIGGIIANITFIIISIVSYVLSVSSSPVLSKLSLVVAILMAIISGVLGFKKMHQYLQKDVQNL